MNTGQWPPVPLSGTITTSKTVSCVNPINYVAPVFPTPAGTQHNDGMTLRDYFAAAALQGLMASCPWEQVDEVPQKAYEISDAMIKAREAKP